MPEGIYKVVEVEALEEYKFEEDISKRSYTFGIGRSKPAKYETSEEFEDMFYGYGAIDYTIVIPSENGGYIKMGSSSKRVNIPADKTLSGEAIEVPAASGLMIKYNSFIIPLPYNWEYYSKNFSRRQIIS